MVNVNGKLSIMRARRNPVIFDSLDRFVFFPNNKVCQRSIARVAIADRAIVCKDDVSRWAKKMSEIDADYLERVFTFTVVRNPFDRAVSAFAYLQGNGTIERRMKFTTFCTEVLRRQGTSFDPHFDPQSDGLFCDGELIPEFVGRFESLEEDWAKITIAIDGPPLLAHINKSKRRVRYTDYYNDHSRQVIASLYADDLNNFDYEFESLKRKFVLLK